MSVALSDLANGCIVHFVTPCTVLTMFGGMNAPLYAEFKKEATALINASENSLKHSDGG